MCGQEAFALLGRLVPPLAPSSQLHPVAASHLLQPEGRRALALGAPHHPLPGVSGGIPCPGAKQGRSNRGDLQPRLPPSED